LKNFFFYILAPNSLKILDTIENCTLTNNTVVSETSLYKIKQVGNCYFLKDLSVGDMIYNIEMYPQKGPKLVRAGGTSALILQKKNDSYITIKLPSGEHRLISSNCKAFLGNLSNENHRTII